MACLHVPTLRGWLHVRVSATLSLKKKKIYFPSTGCTDLLNPASLAAITQTYLHINVPKCIFSPSHACMCPLWVEDCLYVYQWPCLWKNWNIFLWLIAINPAWFISAPMQQLHENIFIYLCTQVLIFTIACLHVSTWCRGLSIRVSAPLSLKKTEIFSFDWLHWSTQPCLIANTMQQLHEHIYIADKFFLNVCTSNF